MLCSTKTALPSRYMQHRAFPSNRDRDYLVGCSLVPLPPQTIHMSLDIIVLSVVPDSGQATNEATRSQASEKNADHRPSTILRTACGWPDWLIC
jgi:hypothetical protein